MLLVNVLASLEFVLTNYDVADPLNHKDFSSFDMKLFP